MIRIVKMALKMRLRYSAYAVRYTRKLLPSLMHSTPSWPSAVCSCPLPPQRSCVDGTDTRSPSGCVRISDFDQLAAELTVSSVEQNSKSPLLQLPAEIRNQIFENVLSNLVILPGDEDGTLCYVKDFDGAGARYQPGVAFALLRVCRQIYAETSLMPCARNTLILSYPNLWNLSQSSNFRLGAPALLLGQRDAIRSVSIYGFYAELFYDPGFYTVKAVTFRDARVTDFFPHLDRVVLKDDEMLGVWKSWVKESENTALVEMVRMHEGKDDLQVVDYLSL
jgi:hypothetical protein